jgi:hypothetical protein
MTLRPKLTSRSRLRWSLAALVLCLLPGPARAVDVDGDFYFDETTPTPKAVLALQDCDADEKTAAHRKPFAGGFIFAIQCPSNNENFIETLIFSEHEDGSGGWLLKFPKSPRNKDFSDVISNIRWFPETNEISEIFVDRENPPVCRTEARWKLEGKKRKPKLVFLRETRDCEGKKGWAVVVGKK